MFKLVAAVTFAASLTASAQMNIWSSRQTSLGLRIVQLANIAVEESAEN